MRDTIQARLAAVEARQAAIESRLATVDRWQADADQALAEFPAAFRRSLGLQDPAGRDTPASGPGHPRAKTVRVATSRHTTTVLRRGG